MKKQVKLDCTIEQVHKYFEKNIYTAKWNLHNLSLFHEKSMFIGDINDKAFRLMYHESPIDNVYNNKSIWTFNQLIAPTVMYGNIVAVSDGVEIHYYFGKRKVVIVVAAFFEIYSILALCASLILFMASEGLSKVMIATTMFVFFFLSGIYLLFSSEKDKKRLIKCIENIAGQQN